MTIGFTKFLNKKHHSICWMGIGDSLILLFMSAHCTLAECHTDCRLQTAHFHIYLLQGK